jgi:hypothetical protein
MPSVSTAQQHAMAAAANGADFPLARRLRSSMSSEQLHDFASGPTAGKPEHARSTAAHSLRNLKHRLKHHGK